MNAVSKLLIALALISLVPMFRSPKALTSKPLAGRLVTQLAARQFDKVEAQFDDQMKAALPVAKLPEVWDSLLAQAGPFKSIASVKVTEKQGLHAAFVTCEFQNATLDAKISWTRRAR